jgi:hypothetical protein
VNKYDNGEKISCTFPDNKTYYPAGGSIAAVVKGWGEAADEFKRREEAARERKARGEVWVPKDCKTINEAYERIEQSNGALTTIVLGQREHSVDGGRLDIKCPVNIVGSPDVLDKSTIIVQGGIDIRSNIYGTVHVEHLTIRGSKKWGVDGYSSFTLNDLIIEQCGGCGVYAGGSSTIGRCCNVVISKCQEAGVCAGRGASIILEGRETSIYENCSGGNDYYYGLVVSGTSSKIQIVSPLTKESISKRNGGGGDWGAGWDANINQIEIIEEEKKKKIVKNI